MKKIYTYSVPLFVTTLMILPVMASAAFLGGNDGNAGNLGDAMTTFLNFLSNVVIPFILAIGFFMFVWGIFNYFILGGANDDAKEKGKSLIIYAIAGFVVILAFWGIVNIFISGVGLQNETLEYIPKTIPTPGTL